MGYFFLASLIEQTEKARALLLRVEPEKLLSAKQLDIFQLFVATYTLSVLEIDQKLGGKLHKQTIKQALSRLVELQLLERLGSGRATRYR